MDKHQAATIPVRQLSQPVVLLATGLGSGLSPVAPGTWGTAMAIPFYLLLQPLEWSDYLAFVLLSAIAGIWICGYAAERLGVHDHPGIVWDEMVGYWLTMFAAPEGWQWMVLGFVLFRIFDIFKPWPISWLDRRVHGGLGIMADDLVAGAAALLCLQGAVWYLR